MNKKVTFDPIQSVVSPAWIFALGILIVNDHILKAALGNVFTGKLSDFAGLFLAPVLLAFIVGVKTKRGLQLSGLAVGIVFAAINTSSTAASFWDRSLSLIYPYSTTVDPTDLIALIMIPMGIIWFGSSVEQVQRKNIYLGRVIAFVGLCASLASTNPQDEEFVPMDSSVVSIYNQSNELHILRIRNLDAGISLDCDVILKAPEKYLSANFFGEPTEWLLQSGQQIPIRVTEEVGQLCNAALVESETLPDVIVFWTNDLVVKTFPFDFDIPRTIQADEQTLVIHADYPAGAEDFHEWRFRTECGARADFCARETLVDAAKIPPGTSYYWESDSEIGTLHHAKPSSLDRRRPEPTEECAAPSAEVGVFWEDNYSRANDLRVTDIREGLDGCHEIFMRSENSNEDLSFLICVPFETISDLKPTEEFPAVVIAFTETATFSSISLLIRAVYYDDVEAQNFATVKSVHISRGGIAGQPEFSFTERPRLDCIPQVENCGVTLPLDLEVDGQLLKPGENTIVGSVIKRRVYLVRAEYLPVRAEICGTFDQAKTYLETVIITE